MPNETGVFAHPAAFMGPLDPARVFDVRVAGVSALAVNSSGSNFFLVCSGGTLPANDSNSLAVLGTLTLGLAGGINLTAPSNGVLLIANAAGWFDKQLSGAETVHHNRSIASGR